MAIIAPETSRIDSIAASNGDIPFSSMSRSIFSKTTIASSTTIPIAMTIAKSVSVLIPKPKSHKPAKVPMSETGTAIKGMSVARQLPKNKNNTKTTKAPASKSVCSTSLIEALTKRVVSNGTS